MRSPCARPPARFRRTGSSSRPIARTSRPNRCAARGTSPPTWCIRSVFSPRREARAGRGRRRPDPRECRRSIRVGMTVAPKKALGQHFLVDENILGVIERLSDLRSTDVVLEVGPGLGILTRRLAERARLVHAIELDRSLEPELRAALGELLERSSDLGRRTPARDRRARARTHQARRQPPVQRRDSARGRVPRARTVIAALVRDGAARGGRPLLRRAEDEGVRRGLGARAALRPEGGLPCRFAVGVPSAATSRLRARGLRA